MNVGGINKVHKKLSLQYHQMNLRYFPHFLLSETVHHLKKILTHIVNYSRVHCNT